MPILSPSFSHYIRQKGALLSSLVTGFVCFAFVSLLAANCCESLAQDANAGDAIRRIERDYNAAEETRRLTAVTLRARESVSLASNLIRLGDIVEPVDPDLSGWAQLARLGIGLVPLDGTEMVIERDRLEPFIHSGHKSPVLIRWLGPRQIKVSCQSGGRRIRTPAIPNADRNVAVSSPLSTSEILRATATSPVRGSDGAASSRSHAVHSIANIDPQHISKVERWILGASSGSGGNTLDRYDFQVREVEKIRPTQGVLDVAILGAGLIQVTDPMTNRLACVPAGELVVDVNGDLVLANRKVVMPLFPTVNIPSETESIRIKSDGTVEVQARKNVNWSIAGKITVAAHGRLANDANSVGSVLLASATALDAERLAAKSLAEKSTETWQVLQGFLESSSQEACQDFEAISGIDSVTALHGLREGLCKFRIQGRGLDGPVDLILGMHLTAKPVVVAPKKSFPRGHRLAVEDLQLISIEAGEADTQQYESLPQLVGMEVSKSLRSGRPILKADVRQPTLVHRGDLVDLRVVGSGIVITTAAKAIEDGPLNGLVEVETLRPRKRKIARVVDSGVVEILSRPPKVGNLLEKRRK